MVHDEGVTNRGYQMSSHGDEMASYMGFQYTMNMNSMGCTL